MKILVVEDDVSLREILSTVLSDEGYQVQLAASGNEAKALLSSDPDFALIISDYLMPNGDGKELLEFVRSRNPSRPAFFMITGQASLSRGEILRMGAQEYILKPFRIEEFIRTIRSYMKKAGGSE